MREIKRRRLKLIPLADKKKVEEYTRFSQSTLRNWRVHGKYPELFVKIAGVFIFMVENGTDWSEKL